MNGQSESIRMNPVYMKQSEIFRIIPEFVSEPIEPIENQSEPVIRMNPVNPNESELIRMNPVYTNQSEIFRIIPEFVSESIEPIENQSELVI